MEMLLPMRVDSFMIRAFAEEDLVDVDKAEEAAPMGGLDVGLRACTREQYLRFPRPSLRHLWQRRRTQGRGE